MLTYRTQILFDFDTIQKLKQLAKKNKTTVGKLVRSAVERNYSFSQSYAKRHKAWKTILNTRPAISKEDINYNDLISYGRNL
jgi:hypothetical protein